MDNEQTFASSESDASQSTSETGQTVFSRRSLGLIAAGIGASTLGATAPARAADEKSALPEGYEGNIAVCTTLVVKAEDEAAADAVWDMHKAWLKRSHGPWGMVSYTIAKNTEFKDALNPNATETTGRIIYVIHEVYRHLDGLLKHYAQSADGGYVDAFVKICTAEGNEFHVLQGAPVTHSLLPKDLDFPIKL